MLLGSLAFFSVKATFKEGIKIKVSKSLPFSVIKAQTRETIIIKEAANKIPQPIKLRLQKEVLPSFSKTKLLLLVAVCFLKSEDIFD